MCVYSVYQSDDKPLTILAVDVQRKLKYRNIMGIKSAEKEYFGDYIK